MGCVKRQRGRTIMLIGNDGLWILYQYRYVGENVFSIHIKGAMRDLELPLSYQKRPFQGKRPA